MFLLLLFQYAESGVFSCSQTRGLPGLPPLPPSHETPSELYQVGYICAAASITNEQIVIVLNKLSHFN